MIYSFRANLLMRIWTGLLLLFVAMLMGGMIADVDGRARDLLFAAILMGLILITSILILVGACRLLIGIFRVVLWR